MITVENKQVKINGGKIILADTPESRLKYLDTRELVLLAELDVNALTATVRGGDIKDITPYIGNDPANGFDIPKIQKWYDYLKAANGAGIVPFLMLSEKENHFSITIEQEKELIEMLVQFFQNLSVIWTKEEYPRGNDGRLRDVYGFLKSTIKTHNANHIIALHNNTDEVNWTGHNDTVELIQLQTKLATGNASIKKAYDAGFAVFQSELVGGVNTGNCAQWCNLGAGMSSGAGAYFPADDLKAPQYIGQNLKYQKEYEIMVRELGGEPQVTKEPITSKIFTDSSITINDKYNLKLQKV